MFEEHPIMAKFNVVMNETYESLNPSMELSQWKLLQMWTLLDNILVDNPQLESYYQAFADDLKML
jgi:hypothetical protein